MRALSHAVVFCTFLSIIAVAQTKSPATTSPNKPAASATRTIPTIKCVDRNTAAACKSFKQLVEARDAPLLAQVWGFAGQTMKQTSYVCFRPQSDTFSVIQLVLPNKLRPTIDYDEELAKYADDSFPTNHLMRESAASGKKLMEDAAFNDFSDPPAISQYTKDQWYEDHSKQLIYGNGFAIDSQYQDGIAAGQLSDFGEWKAPAGSGNNKPMWFLGTNAWIEKFNRQHGNTAAKDDDPKQGHISSDSSSIQIHFKYENQAHDMTDYSMQIHPLTGRFVEYFQSSAGDDQTSGTCMIFK